MKLRISMLTLAAALTLAVATPAAAQTADNRFQARIAFTDLNLGNEAGADAALNRLRGAALETCGARGGPMTVGEHQRLRSCATAFVQKGVIRLENPLVARRYLERGGRLPAVTVASL